MRDLGAVAGNVFGSIRRTCAEVTHFDTVVQFQLLLCFLHLSNLFLLRGFCRAKSATFEAG